MASINAREQLGIAALKQIDELQVKTLASIPHLYDNLSVISRITKLAGRAIPEIEQGLQKKERGDKYTLLGREDRLLKVIQSDLETLKRLDTTHTKIAELLRRKGFPHWLPMRQPLVQKLPNGQQIYVSALTDTEWEGRYFFKDEEESVENYWFTITNATTKESINIYDRMVEFIEKYGFFGGFGNNVFRVDPIALVAILTGVRKVDLRARFKAENEEKKAEAPRALAGPIEVRASSPSEIDDLIKKYEDSWCVIS